jgi:hypothetical protein
LRTEQSAVSA